MNVGPCLFSSNLGASLKSGTLNEFTVTYIFAVFSFLCLFVVTHVLKLPNDKCPDYVPVRLFMTF